MPGGASWLTLTRSSQKAAAASQSRSCRTCIASAAADWEWIANQNPDVPADELTKIVTEAYRENSYPRGKLNVDYSTWHDLLDGGQMALYPDVRPDTLYILSAQNNSLGLWRVYERKCNL